MWFVYALYNPGNEKIYIGQTGDIEQRLADHNRKRGRHFTAQFKGEWILIYREQVISRSQALIREKQLKSFRGREFVKKYIPR